MSDAERYLQELRCALPVGCRRRLVAEVREHFDSAVASEEERGVGRVEAERLTIARLGPAQALADQLLADLRSGALGRRGRLAVSLTTARLVAVAVVLVIAIVAGAVLVEGRSSSAPSPEESTRTVVLTTKDVHVLVFALQANVQARYTRGARPVVLRLVPTR